MYKGFYARQVSRPPIGNSVNIVEPIYVFLFIEGQPSGYGAGLQPTCYTCLKACCHSMAYHIIIILEVLSRTMIGMHLI